DLPANAATTIDLRIKDIRQSNEIKKVMEAKLGNAFTVQSWYDLHTELYSVMEIERWVAYIILLLIVGVAAFSIFSSLTLTVFEKQRDIGLLRALGATLAGIRNIYFYEGLMIGALGTLLGCAIGLGVVVA